MPDMYYIMSVEESIREFNWRKSRVSMKTSMHVTSVLNVDNIYLIRIEMVNHSLSYATSKESNNIYRMVQIT